MPLSQLSCAVCLAFVELTKNPIKAKEFAAGLQLLAPRESSFLFTNKAMFTKKNLENKKQDVRDNRHRVLPSSHPSLGTWSTWSAVISLTSRAGELRSAPSLACLFCFFLFFVDLLSSSCVLHPGPCHPGNRR